MATQHAMIVNQSNIDANGHADTWPGAGARLMKGLETMSRCSHCTPMPIGASNSAVRRLRKSTLCAKLRGVLPQKFRAAPMLVTSETALDTNLHRRLSRDD